MERITEYLNSTRSVPFGILSTLPLLLGYYLLLAVGQSPVQNAAETWIYNVIGGNTEVFSLSLGVIYLSCILFVLFRKEYSLESFRTHFPFMILEALGWAVFSWMVISLGMKQLLLSLQQTESLSYISQLGMSLGAGLFEELLFRVAIQGGVFLLLYKLLGFDAWLSAVIAVFLAAFLFSVAHFFGPFGDPIVFTIFLYRLLYGIFFGILIYFRGFAITSWTHALYDVMVVTL